MATSEKRPELIEIAQGLSGVPMCEDYEKMISGMLYVYPVNNYHGATYRYYTASSWQPLILVCSCMG